MSVLFTMSLVSSVCSGRFFPLPGSEIIVTFRKDVEPASSNNHILEHLFELEKNANRSVYATQKPCVLDLS